MTAPALPAWRRTPARRSAFLLAAALPALAWQTARLDPALAARAGLLGLAALAADTAIRHSARNAVGVEPLHLLLHALLLAALWPPGAPPWIPAACLVLALACARLLGGAANNPFAPAALALALATGLAPMLGHELAPGRLLLPSAMQVAGLWLAGALALGALGLLRLAPALAFALPLAFAWFIVGELPAAALVAAAVATFLLADPRHLPATPSGRIALAALAGAGCAIVWLRGAPPATIGAVLVLGGALTPWIEDLTLPARAARKAAT